MENIRLIFVLPEKYNSEKEASEVMVQAYETCKQNVKTDVTWVKENSFAVVVLNKTDIVIFEDFKGEVFENLKGTKCAILGPQAISICLTEGKPIPSYPWPMYNVAMYQCIITSSNLSKTKKMEIKEKVQIMGGCYVDTLAEKVTHLVTDNLKSEKYLAAAEAGVKIMCPSWIEAVWEASQLSDIHANDKEFEEYKCLPFQNLNISCTGLAEGKRKEIELLIKKYGGKYSAKLKLSEADVLLCAGVDVLMSDKYKAARKRPNIKCVDISWLTESIAKGYALPHNDFQVKKPTSTPTKSDAFLNPDFSVLSAISIVNTCDKTSIDLTVNRTMKDLATPSCKAGPSKRKGNPKENYNQLIVNLDIKKAKKAGHYLDGCSVYVTGFSPEHTEKLNKILNLSGATRYDQFSNRITHVICGDPNFHEVKIIKSKGYQCSLVSIQWLLDSMETEQPVNEDNYLLSTCNIDKNELSSPLSRKGLNLLRTERTVVEEEAEEPDKTLEIAEDNAEKSIVQQYLKPTSTVQEDDDTLARLLKNVDNLPDFSTQMQELPKEVPLFKPGETSMQQSSASVSQDETTESRTEMFFDGLKFLVIGFEEDHFEYIKDLIEGFSGEVVSKSYRGIPDYMVVPVFNKSEVRHTGTEIVNEFFINECAKENGLLADICYYHRPLEVPDTNPLKNCVITISGYSSYERNFLKSLIEALGGYNQEQFSRVTSEAKGVVASTHLISDKPSGKKYQAAVKWGLPAVNKDWLLEYVKTEIRVPEAEYLLEDNVQTSTEITSSIGKNVTMKTPRTEFSKPVTPKVNTPQISYQISNNSAIPTVEESNTSLSNLSCFAKFNTPTSIATSETTTPDESAASVSYSSSCQNSGVSTPINQMIPLRLDFGSGEKPFSQATPVNKIWKQYRDSNADVTHSKDSPEHFPWMGIKTPETPLGACMVENPSPRLRKQCELWLRQFPDYESPLPRRLSTPLSEIKRKLWNKILKKGEDTQADEQMDVQELIDLPAHEETEQDIENKLLQFEEMLCASAASKRQSRNFQSTIPIPEGNVEHKDSQACTVGWDFRSQEVSPKIFILTGISDVDRLKMVQQLESLRATVSDLSHYDPSGTHLLCPKPARNEKILSCMAAGKWILHTLYLEKSLAAGHFLDEEEYEFGNPKSAGNFGVKIDKETDMRMKMMHWWRKEVERRGYGAFNDMRAIVIAQKREPIIRVIEAGGGLVVDVRPPFEDTVHATHCLLEQRSIGDYTDYIPLARQGIYLLNTIYISDYLHQPSKSSKEYQNVLKWYRQCCTSSAARPVAVSDD